MLGEEMDSSAPLSFKEIAWGPYKDNHVEGKLGEIRLFIRAFKREERIVPDSLYIIYPNGDKSKFLPGDLGAETIEEMKVAVDIILNLNP